MTPRSPTAHRQLTPRQVERRRNVLRAAQALVARDGYDAVTMRAIAREGGTAEKTLYNIFGTKDRLVALAANERSATVFEQAEIAEPRPGWARLHRFCVEAARATLAEPLLSRAMAVLLLDHADLVGLQALYDHHMGGCVVAMMGDGLLRHDVSQSELVRAIRFGVVASVLFWSKGQITDDEFEPWLIRQCAQALMPSATPLGIALLSTRN